MTKKQSKGRKSSGGSTAAQKKPHGKRGGAKKKKNAESSWKSYIISLLPYVVVAMLSLASVLLLIAPFLPLPTSNFDNSNDDDELIQARTFLNDFVCKYKPKSSPQEVVDVEGYCHPKLVAAPKERTQRVAYDEFTVTEEQHRHLKSKLYSRLYILQLWFRKLFTSTRIAIPANELVMRLPRPLQIWDLDALRDKFIQTEFLGMSESSDIIKAPATHRETGNLLDSGAYLAVHLIRLMHGQRGGECNSEDQEECTQKSNTEWSDASQYEERINLLKPYFDILPSRHYVSTPVDSDSTPKDLHEHPLIWPKSTLESLFAKYTHSFDLIVQYRRMIQSEYDALGQASSVFSSNVDFPEYLNMRVNVLSRAFGVPALESDSGAQWSASSGETIGGSSLLDELTSYPTSNFGTYLESTHQPSEVFRLRAMSPLLDMYNSHPNPNVLWRYNEKTSSYDIRASPDHRISPGDALLVSYGKYTEGHLFAKFGYVNGDGSSPTEANLAIFHRLFGDVGLGRQFSQLPFHEWDSTSSPNEFQGETELTKQVIDMQSKELIRYLIFDDGYKECVRVNDEDEYDRHGELKLLKLQHLMRIANRLAAWVVRLPAKFPDATPLQDLSQRPELEIENKAGINANRMLSTCRLMSLTADDFGGEAAEILRGGLYSDSFEVEKGDPALEYRTMRCVARLCGIALNRYGEYLSPQGRQEPRGFGTREWDSWYVREGEMRVLGITRQTLISEAERLKRRHNLQSDEAATVREDGPCPMEYSLPLLSKI